MVEDQARELGHLEAEASAILRGASVSRGLSCSKSRYLHCVWGIWLLVVVTHFIQPTNGYFMCGSLSLNKDGACIYIICVVRKVCSCLMYRVFHFLSWNGVTHMYMCIPRVKYWIRSSKYGLSHVY